MPSSSEVKPLNLSLIGMSNRGKTYWGRRLAPLGFTHLCADDSIAKVIKAELALDGYSGDIADVAAWMGLPHEERSHGRQKRYLAIEESLMEQALMSLWHRRDRVVLDTTGSVIHTDPLICEVLHDLTTVVHLETPPELQEEMFQRFLAEPKPIIWGRHYAPLEGEEPAQTLRRCYPQLLAWRSEQYAKYADVTLPVDVISRCETATGFLTEIALRAPDFNTHNLQLTVTP